jgi:hypothetical protein
MALAGDDCLWFLPSALNVKVKKFNQARVNGGSNYPVYPGLINVQSNSRTYTTAKAKLIT